MSGMLSGHVLNSDSKNTLTAQLEQVYMLWNHYYSFSRGSQFSSDKHQVMSWPVVRSLPFSMVKLTWYFSSLNHPTYCTRHPYVPESFSVILEMVRVTSPVFSSPNNWYLTDDLRVTSDPSVEIISLSQPPELGMIPFPQQMCCRPWDLASYLNGRVIFWPSIPMIWLHSLTENEREEVVRTEFYFKSYSFTY